MTPDPDPEASGKANLATRSVRVFCPTCKKAKTIPIPAYVFAGQDSGIVSVQIRPDLVCEHQFVVHLDQNLQIRGCEAIDFRLTLAAPKPPAGAIGQDPSAPAGELTFADLLQKFGSNATSHLFYAMIMDYPACVVVYPTDSPNLQQLLNAFFHAALPGDWTAKWGKKRGVVEQLPREEYAGRHAKIARRAQFALDTSGIILHQPWSRKEPLDFERALMKDLLKIKTERGQSAAIKEKIHEIQLKMVFVADQLRQTKQIYEHDLKKRLKAHFKTKHKTPYLNMLKTLVARRVRNGPKLVRRLVVRTIEKFDEVIW